MNKNSFDIKKIVGIATFAALAFVVTLATSWIKVSFLTFDAKDAVITIAAFIYGPLSALIISVIVALIEFVTISTTYWYGLIMNILSSAVFSLTASLIYKYNRTINGALIGLFSSVVATTGTMLLANMFITPLYFGLPVMAPYVMSMLPTLLLPFNLAKALMNGAIAMLMYKPVLLALTRSRLISGRNVSLGFNRNSVIIIAAGSLFVAAALVIFLVFL